MTPVTTFGALDKGAGFTFHTAVVVGFPATTVFTKKDSFSFMSGKTTLTLDAPKTMKVVPVVPSGSVLN